MTHTSRACLVALLAVGAVALPTTSDACAPAPPRNVVVEIASESAIIIWDAPNKTQHFIRRATFAAAGQGDTKVTDFGFLVPTPTRPVLEEASDASFDELAKVTAPRTETHKAPSGGGGCGIGCAGARAPDKASAVTVLEEKRVAGYDAAILKATDVDALEKWLTDHKYEFRPALKDWVKPYVDKGWIITAFKIARDQNAAPTVAVGSTAVRMSFTTDVPFFPYREPADMHDAKAKRMLRVFFLTDRKMAGQLDGGTHWPGKVAWAGKLTAEQGQTLAPLLKIPGYAPGEETWLTEFEDSSSPRPGTSDLTFVASADQTPVERPKRIIYAKRSDAAGKAGFAAFALGVVCVYLVSRLWFARR